MNEEEGETNKEKWTLNKTPITKPKKEKVGEIKKKIRSQRNQEET